MLKLLLTTILAVYVPPIHGQKYISAGGTVDIATGGQGVRVKVDAAGITWSSNNLQGVALTSESLVVAASGTYLASWYVAVDGTQGKKYLFEVITDTDNNPANGVTSSNDQCHNDFTVQAQTHGPNGAKCLLALAAGNFVYLAVIEPGAGGGTNFSIDHGGLTIIRTGN